MKSEVIFEDESHTESSFTFFLFHSFIHIIRIHLNENRIYYICCGYVNFSLDTETPWIRLTCEKRGKLEMKYFSHVLCMFINIYRQDRLYIVM